MSFGEIPVPGKRRLPSGHYEPGPDVLALAWSSGTRAKQEGTDFASVIARLPSDRLVFWAGRMRCCYHERRLIESELGRRRVSADPKDAPGQGLLF